MVNDGIAYSFGIILEPMRSDLGISVGSISLVGGALAGVTMLVGPLAAACVNRWTIKGSFKVCLQISSRFGSQITCIFGSLIASSTMFL